MISLYHPGRSWLHRMPAGLKLLALAALSLVLMPQTSLPLLAGTLLVTVALYRSMGPGGLARLAVLRALLPIAVVLFVFQGVVGTWQMGAVVVLRFLVLVLLANLVTLTTRMDAMLAAVEPLFKPLALVGVPPRVPSLAVIMAIRFVPVLHHVQQALGEAWQARGGGRMSWRIIPPLIVVALKMADHVADALSARGGAAGLSPPSRGSVRL